MTLYELADTVTLQGNIIIKVFDGEGNEKESRFVHESTGFNCICDDADDLEDCEVSYMYPERGTGTAWLVIEVIREEEV